MLNLYQMADLLLFIRLDPKPTSTLLNESKYRKVNSENTSYSVCTQDVNRTFYTIIRY